MFSIFRKMLFNDLDGDLMNKEQPLKQLKLDEILLYFLKQEDGVDGEEEEDEIKRRIDDDLNIINLVLKDFYLNEIKNKKSLNYWNSLNEESVDKEKCISEFEGKFRET